MQDCVRVCCWRARAIHPGECSRRARVRVRVRWVGEAGGGRVRSGCMGTMATSLQEEAHRYCRAACSGMCVWWLLQPRWRVGQGLPARQVSRQQSNLLRCVCVCLCSYKRSRV